MSPQSRGISHFLPTKNIFFTFLDSADVSACFNFRRDFADFFSENFFVTKHQVWNFFAAKRHDRNRWNLVGRTTEPNPTKCIFWKKSYRPILPLLPVKHGSVETIFKKFQGGPRISHAHQIRHGHRAPGPAWACKIRSPAHFRFVPQRSPKIVKIFDFSKNSSGFPTPVMVP